MRTVSTDFKANANSKSRSTKIRLKAYTSNNAESVFTEDSILNANIDIGSTTGLQIGVTYCAKLSISLIGIGSFNNYKRLKLEVGFGELDEWLSLGTFYIDSVNTSQKITKINAFDRMLRLQKSYAQQVPAKQSWKAYLNEICTKRSITYADDTFGLPENVQINDEIKKGTDKDGKSVFFTYREVLNYLASANATNLFFVDDELQGASFTRVSDTIPASRIYEDSYTNETYTVNDVKWVQNGQSASKNDADATGVVQFVNPLNWGSREYIYNLFNSRIFGITYEGGTVKTLGCGWRQIGDIITTKSVDNNGLDISHELLITGIKYTINRGEFTETLYSSAQTSSQANYNNGDVQGQTVQPSVVGYGGGGGGVQTYTTAIDFTDTGFTDKFKDESGSEQTNSWSWQISGNNITSLYNSDTGRSILISGLETSDEFLTIAEVDEIWAEVIAE